MPILVFLGLSVLDLGPMYATDIRQTDRRQTKASLNVPAYYGRGHINTRVSVTAASGSSATDVLRSCDLNDLE